MLREMSAALAIPVADNVAAARTRIVLFFMVTSSAPVGELSFPIQTRSLPIGERRQIDGTIYRGV
jgi:hypothetical protein